MFRQTFHRGLLVSAIGLGLLVSATPAFGQAIGAIRGIVTDEAGQAVAEAELTFTFLGDVDITVTLKTNDKGEFTRSGLRTGSWRMVATKGDLTGTQNVRVNIAAMTRSDTLVIKAATTGATDTSTMTDKEVEERNIMAAEMEASFAAGRAAMETDPDAAIASFMAVVAKSPQCAACYANIGDANMKKGDLAAAEVAYKQAIEFDEKQAGSYAALAILYNQQKKFDEATAMSQKANELLGASATGGNPAALYNEAIILWNAGKFPEAKTGFEKVIALDATMAEAHYQLGMANLNLGQLPDAAKSFEEYLRLAPEGENAEMAKSILKQIK